MEKSKPTTNNSLRMVDIKYVIDIVDSNVNNLTGTTSSITSDANGLRDALQVVKGQQDNMDLIAKEIDIWLKKGIKDKPIVFMFAGASGTGKTYTARTIAKCLNSQDYGFVQVNMNELSLETETWKLLGGPKGCVGSDTDSSLFVVRKKTDKLILVFDEFEKAHSSLYPIILTLMEKGELSNGHGELFDFKNSIIIFNTNLAAKELIRAKEKLVKEGKSTESYEFQINIRNILKLYGINKDVCELVNYVLVFNMLGNDALSEIVIEEIRKLGKAYGLGINEIPEILVNEITSQIVRINEGVRPVSNIIADMFEEMFHNIQNCI